MTFWQLKQIRCLSSPSLSYRVNISLIWIQHFPDKDDLWIPVPHLSLFPFNYVAFVLLFIYLCKLYCTCLCLPYTCSSPLSLSYPTKYLFLSLYLRSSHSLNLNGQSHEITTFVNWMTLSIYTLYVVVSGIFMSILPFFVLEVIELLIRLLQKQNSLPVLTERCCCSNVQIKADLRN